MTERKGICTTALIWGVGIALILLIYRENALPVALSGIRINGGSEGVGLLTFSRGCACCFRYMSALVSICTGISRVGRICWFAVSPMAGGGGAGAWGFLFRLLYILSAWVWPGSCGSLRRKAW